MPKVINYNCYVISFAWVFLVANNELLSLNLASQRYHHNKQLDIKLQMLRGFKKMFDAMHFINYLNRPIATEVDSTYLGYQSTAPVGEREPVTLRSLVRRLGGYAIQVDKFILSIIIWHERNTCKC